MGKRPLCILCLTFLVIRSVLLLIAGGETLTHVPASSIFSTEGQSNHVLLEGQVYQKRNTSKVQILYLKHNSIVQGNDSYYESKILIYDDTFAEIPIGKTVLLKGKSSCFETARNPGNFDQQLYYAKQGIYGFVWCGELVAVSGKENGLLEELHQLRENWKQTILSNMTGENGDVLCAMLLSEKSGMDEEVKELYQKNGLSHLLAISGLHISFIGLGIYQLLRKLGGSFVGAGMAAVLLLSLYVVMIGFSVSVVRAYVMLLLRIGADMTGRVYDMLTSLMLAATILILYQPLYLADAGFYLSHGAILGILFVLPVLKQVLPLKGKWLEGGYASIAINVTLFPVLLWFYFEFPVYSMVLNMVAIPLMAVVLGVGIFGSVGALWFPAAGEILLKPCDVLLSFFQWLGELGSRLPASRLVFGKPDWWEVVIYYVVLILGIILLHSRGEAGRESVREVERKTQLSVDEKTSRQTRATWEGMQKRLAKMVAGVGLLGFVIVLFAKFPDGTLQVTMLDVGQGDCIFLKGPKGHTYLVDGGSSDVEQVGKYRIEPFLKSQGVGSLDYVFVSHGDLDHYSGITEMLKRQRFGVKIKTLVMPVNYKQDEKLLGLAQLAYEQGTDVVVIDGGRVVSEGKLKLACIQPEKNGITLEGNEGSMVLEVSFESFDMLCTGDVEAEGEVLLRQKLKGKSYDVLKVAHHGSKNSTEEDFLNIVKPKIALISAGEKNSYGHPHVETVERLKKQGCEILSTMEWGAIQLKTDGEFIDIFPSSI